MKHVQEMWRQHVNHASVSGRTSLCSLFLKGSNEIFSKCAGRKVVVHWTGCKHSGVERSESPTIAGSISEDWFRCEGENVLVHF